jgi:hypothetical protein
MWERACSRMRCTSRQMGWLTAVFASKPAPTFLIAFEINIL